ncbi:MAG: DUF11 domain-containing protein, partial [Caldilineaceae bacterium]|nr:DUF11 domain-containing protein [Caldilineaceae bacterium]
MIFSMLSSMMSPLYTPANSTTPSFAFPGEVRAPAPLPAKTTPVETQALPRVVANVSDQPQSLATIEEASKRLPDLAAAPPWISTPARATTDSAVSNMAEHELSGVLAPDWLSKAPKGGAGQAEVIATTPASEIALPSSWKMLDASNALPPELATLESGATLGSALTPAWYGGLDNEENTSTFADASETAPAGLFSPHLGAAFYQTGGDNQCSASSRVTFALVAPPYPVSRGNVDGDVYTVTVKNNDSITTTNVTLYIDPNQGFSYLGNSASVQSSISGTLTYSDTGSGAPGAPALIAITGDITSTTLNAGEIITFTFRLATNADAISAQQLVVRLQSGALDCGIYRVQNVPTVRGNLTVQKSPNIRTAKLGDTLGWTVKLINTGLGVVYGAEVEDIFGAGYINTVLDELPTAPITLAAGASATYYVTGTVNACNQLTNTANVWWPIGNQDSTATPDNPASSKVDVRFTLENPNVSLQVTPASITVPFCTPMTRTVVVTATTSNTAKNVQIAANTHSFSVSNIRPGWSYSGGVFTYIGGPLAGYLFADQPAILSFDVSGPTACSASNPALSFQPRYTNACDVPFNGPTVSAPSVNYAPDRPTINVTINGPYSVRARQTFDYVINLNATNIQNITDTISITDMIPSSFIISETSATTGSVNVTGQQITWAVNTPGSGALSASLLITATVREDVACSAYNLITNDVIATAPTCPNCGVLEDSDQVSTYIEDVDGPLAGTKTVSGDTEICGETGLLMENLYYINLPTTLAALVFTETLGLSGPGLPGLPSPLLYVSDTLSVTLNGVDATSLMTIAATSPQLVVDLDRLRELEANVTLTQLSTPAIVNAGDSVTYTLTISNRGPATAENVLVHDPLPAGLSLDSVAASQGSCSAPNVSCTVGDLVADASAVITIVATVDGARQADIVNVAYASFQELNGIVVTTQATARTQVTAAAPLASTDLQIAKRSEQNNVIAGSALTYTIVVTNSGPAIANNVTVVDALPFSFTLSSATPSQGSCGAATHPVVCELGELPVDASAIITVVVMAEASVSADVANTAHVIADNPDSNLADNQASVQTHVIQRIPLMLSYRVIAPEASLAGAISRTWHNWSLLYVEGLGTACRNNDTLYLGAPTTILRGDLGIAINPSTPNSCEPEAVTLNVTGGAAGELTDNLIVTFTLGAKDVYTVTGYSGFFGANPPSTVISAANRITWTWDAALPITAAGQIHLNVLRPCAATGALTSNLSFQDRCDATFTKADSDDFVPTTPNLSLFLTPSKYEVVDRTAVWTTYLINTGNGDAVNALITNTLGAGLAYSSSVVTGAAGVIAQPNVGDGNDVQWVIPRLPPGGQVRIDVIADVIACTGLNMQAFADASCLSGTCSAVGPQEVQLVRAPAALLSSNKQIAELPLCESGPVELTVQNASAGAAEYGFVITDTLRYVTAISGTFALTVTNRSGAVITTTSEFTPVMTRNGYTQTLVWDAANLPVDDPLRTILERRDAGDIIRIGFQVQSSCVSAGQSEVQSSVTAVEACQLPLAGNENAVSLKVTEPQLVVTKLVRNATAGGGYVAGGYAGAGDTLVYEVVVNNIGQQRVTNLFVEDQLPPTFNLTAVDVLTSSQSGSPPLLKWHEAGGVTLEVNQMRVYHITGTVTADACTNPNTVNRASASYGCSTADVCAAASSTVTTTFSTKPAFTLATPGATLDQCSGGPIIVNFPNAGARAENVVLTYTLPAGLAYAGLATGSYPAPTISPTVDATGVITWLYDVINQEVTTNTLRFNVRNAAGVCAAPGANSGVAGLGYEDSCGNRIDDVAESTASITVQASDLVVSQSPRTRPVVDGQVYTWTITITNPGNSATNNLLVTETVGSGWEVVAATAGSPGGATPITTTGAVTWQVGALAGNDGVWSATVSARARAAASDYETTVTATTACEDGGCLQRRTYTTYATPNNEFSKSVTPAVATIGDLITFTVNADLYGDVPYTSTLLTDTLPAGLGYVAASLRVIQDIDGAASSQTLAPTSAPAANASGDIFWNVGDLAGQVVMTTVITAVVQNIMPAFQGEVFTNTARLTYRDDSQAYGFDASAPVTVIEPLLHIGKRAVTAGACDARLFEHNFNSGSAADWTTSGGAWSVVAHTYQVAAPAAALALNGNTTWSDYSYSAMLRSTDATGGDLGLIFRAQSASQYYRVRWTRNAAGNAGSYVVERVNGGVTTIGAASGAFFDLNRWYHVEVRVTGNRFRVYIDGNLALDVTDAAPPWSAGQIGFYANSQTNAYFDNALVTRLDSAGCTVGANDLVTYTLTISNQGEAPARDLVITDAIPAGTSLHAYTFASSDPGAAVNTAPTPIPGATGDLLWTINQLAPINPFVTNHHAAITLTVVLRVSPTIPASSLLTNQASLAYDSQTGSGPVGVQRSYSGGSHSTSVQTVAPPGLTKSVAPFTATIGQIVVYTITVPSTPITAALTTVTVTDQIKTNLRVTETSIVANPALVNPAVLFSGQQVTATFERIEASAQAQIVVTGVVANAALNQDGVVVTNTARLAYTDGIGTPGASHVLTSNQVSTELVEPVLQIQKSATPNTGLRAGDTVTYALTIRHAATSRSTAYAVVVTDAVPAVLAYTPDTLRVTSPSGEIISTTVGNNLTITVTDYPTPSAPIYITYTATVIQAAEPSSTYTNTAFVRYISLPGTPDARTGSGVGVNDYYTSTQATIQTAALTINKSLDNDIYYSIGDLITYTVVIPLPTGATRALVVTDTVPAGLLYLAPTSTVAVTATPNITLSYAITPSTGNGSSASTAILRMLAPINNTTGASAVLTWTMQLLVVDDAARTVNFNSAVKTNQAALTYVNAQNQTLSASDSAESTTIYEPLLHIGKSYVTDAACAATLLQETFNAGATGWTSSSGAWSTIAAPGWVRAPSGVTSLFTRSGASFTDFSYSAIVSATSTSGSLGLVFRVQDANNYYRFVWTGAAPHYRLERVSGGAPTTVAAAAGFIANRWYHFEVRAVGNQFTIYRDGQQILSGADSTIASGTVGLYVASNNAAFDDVLVTRLGDDSCAVDVGDLVTYTLTISNQNRLTGYDLVITDVLPVHMVYVASALASNDPTAALTASPTPGDTGTLVWRMNHLTPTTPFNPLQHAWAVITLTARVQDDVSAGIRMPNQALLVYDNMAGTGPVGVERTYSGGSHSTSVRSADATLVKSNAPLTVTIGETFRYTLTFPGSGGIAANLYTATLTDTLPAGFRMIGQPQVIVDPSANLDPGAISTARATTKTVLIDFTRIPSYTQVTAVITAVVENLAINQDGVRYTNTATLGWRDLSGNVVAPVTSNPVTTDLVEPQLIIEKTVYPTNVTPGDTVFYTLRIYHAPTSTVPAYNVLISDTLRTWLSYISGSWEANNDPYSLASTGVYTVNLPNLQAYFPVIGTSINAANPLILRYQAVVNVDVAPGTIITNVADTRWTSLLTDPYGDVRTGSGGINDYRVADDAQVSLDQFTIVKHGPITVTAGALVTYTINVGNGSPVTGANARVVDTISFRVTNITGTFSTPLLQGVCSLPSTGPQGSTIECQLGNLPPQSTGVVTITGRVDPATPDGALVDDYADFFITDSNGVE